MASEKFPHIAGSVLPEHYLAIGKVASNWAAFEGLVRSAIWVLAKVEDEAGACITAQLPNISRALDALIALVRLRGGDDTLVRSYKKMAEDSVALGNKRNRIVHDPWAAERGTKRPHRLEITAQKRLVMGYLAHTTEEVEKLVDEINDHIDRFIALTEKAIALVGASLKKSPEQRH